MNRIDGSKLGIAPLPDESSRRLTQAPQMAGGLPDLRQRSKLSNGGFVSAGTHFRHGTRAFKT